MTGARQALGRWGEDLAAAYLQQRGMVILERNFRGKRGEVDIIARDGGDLVFVEVKTRRSDTFGTPQEAVNRRKQMQILHVAEIYLQSHP
ncbi:MAG: YraN family protein, partial [Deltaproteobacteria bacterium]|nr:YraN family protein [Deltaproteobacteria bacterium]